MKMLSDKEVDIVFKWLGVSFFSQACSGRADALDDCSSSSTFSTDKAMVFHLKTFVTPSTEVSSRLYF